MKRLGLFVLMSLLLVSWGRNVNGQTLTPLWQFGSLSNDADGISPMGLIQGTDGYFYGTSGWTNHFHCTVFRITAEGTLTTLWQFGSLSNNTEGYAPNAGVVEGSDGDFYGTTAGGVGQLPFGTVFKITPAGTLTTLWQFGSLPNFVDGLEPSGALVRGRDGNFYGTASFGGGTNRRGTVFKITPSGVLTSLWQFGSSANGTDGGFPDAGLVRGCDGDFYGTTAQGGTNNNGTVFRITSEGTLTTIWQFAGGTDGQSPVTSLARGRDGSFYGTTQAGGTNNHGTLFKITSAGTLTPLWQFGSLSNNAEGKSPQGPLVQGSDGNFYGTTAGGGTNNAGTVFRITAEGTLTTLWQFGSLPNNADGTAPTALVQGSDGSFYGTTRIGGTKGQYGTIFKLCVPLNPPANQISGLSVADSNIVVAVPSVAGETYQLQYRPDFALGDWSNVPDACVSNSLGALLTVTNCGGALAPQGFYRFDITP